MQSEGLEGDGGEQEGVEGNGNGNGNETGQEMASILSIGIMAFFLIFSGTLTS